MLKPSSARFATSRERDPAVAATTRNILGPTRASLLQCRAQFVQPLQKLWGRRRSVAESTVHILKTGLLHQLLLVDHPQLPSAGQRMSGLDDCLRRLPDGARYVTALGSHLCVCQTELGVQEPAICASLGKRFRILADCWQPTMYRLISRQLRHQDVGRSTG